MISAKVFVTTNVHAQLKAVATEAADPRTFPGRISPIINLTRERFLNLFRKIYPESFNLPWNWSKTKTKAQNENNECT